MKLCVGAKTKTEALKGSKQTDQVKIVKEEGRQWSVGGEGFSEGFC